MLFLSLSLHCALPILPVGDCVGLPTMNWAGAIGAVLERGASSRYAYRTNQDETPVKDARSPQNAGAFWLPHAPLRGSCGVLDRRFAGRCQGLSSMRRTSTLEVQKIGRASGRERVCQYV